MFVNENPPVFGNGGQVKLITAADTVHPVMLGKVGSSAAVYITTSVAGTDLQAVRLPARFDYDIGRVEMANAFSLPTDYMQTLKYYIKY